MAETEGRRTRLSREERREHLLDVAATIVTTEGFDGLTMERLAERAGVSKGLGYAYFDDALDAAQVLFERELDQLYEAVRAALVEADGLEGSISGAVAAYFDRVHATGPLLAVLQARFGVPIGKRARPLGREFFVDVVGLMADATRATGATAMALSWLVITVSTTCAELWRSQLLDRATAELICVEFIVGGVERATDPGSS